MADGRVRHVGRYLRFPLQIEVHPRYPLQGEDALQVLITTSGVGSRLRNYTKFTNKSLVEVGDRPAISWIIESYPIDSEFVVTLGYRGELVKQFLHLAYPERNFRFVEVDPFTGPTSSLAYSLLCAQDSLDGPFVYNAGDTLWGGAEIANEPTTNWLAGFRGLDSTLYASFETFGDEVTRLNPKAGDVFEFLYVGLAGIYSTGDFWDCLSAAYNSNSADPELNDLSAIQEMMNKGHKFKVKNLKKWHDIGSISGLDLARQQVAKTFSTLEKSNEAIFYFNSTVFKFFADSNICLSRVERAKQLTPSVPPILDASENWYSYAFVEGEVLSDITTPKILQELLDWAKESMWEKPVRDYSRDVFAEACQSFYFEKSEERIQQFLQRSGVPDREMEINGLVVPPAVEVLALLKKKQILTGRPAVIHGDFILDNLLRTTSKSFIGIDWRQGFGALTSYGDVYYDLAKLKHSLTMNHKILLDEHFEISHQLNGLKVEILRRSTLLECESVLEDWIRKNGFDHRQVEVITPLIWLNMAPLHPQKMGLFLFEYGKYELFKAILA